MGPEGTGSWLQQWGRAEEAAKLHNELGAGKFWSLSQWFSDLSDKGVASSCSKPRSRVPGDAGCVGTAGPRSHTEKHCSRQFWRWGGKTGLGRQGSKFKPSVFQLRFQCFLNDGRKVACVTLIPKVPPDTAPRY